MLKTVKKPALSQLKDRSNLIGAEIGVGAGSHAEGFLSILDIDSVFLIDPYITFKNEFGIVPPEKLKENELIAHTRLIKYEHKITWIKEKSVDAVRFITDNSLDFVYIDGDHAYKHITEDIFLYYPKVKERGLLSGHDYDFESIRNAVTEFIVKQKLGLYLGRAKRGKYDWWIWK